MTYKLKKIFISMFFGLIPMLLSAKGPQVFTEQLIMENLGCGCSYSLPYQNNDEWFPIFMSELDLSGAFILINDKIVKVHKTKGNFYWTNVNTGDQFQLIFKSNIHTLTFDNEVTFTCEDNKSESCEVTKFDSILKFNDGKSIKSIKLMGDCGC